MEKHKVIILGAGVSGLSAALFLHSKGITDVLVINNSNHNLHKACSGLFTQKTINLLKEIDAMPSDYKMKDNITVYYNNKLCRDYTNDHIFILHQNDCLNRTYFDDYLFNKCQENGTKIIENAKNICVNYKKSIVQYNGLECSYDYLLDARGFSLVANNAKYKEIGLELKIKNDKETKEQIRIFLNNRWKGYGWIVSGKQETTIGFTDLYKKEINYKNELKNFALENGYSFDDAVDFRFAFLPLKPLKKVVYKNVLLLGDRACLTDPLTQEGIYYAIKCAKEAAIAIKQNDAKKYQKAIKPFIKSLSLASFIRRVFFKDKHVRNVFELSKKHPISRELFPIYSNDENFSYRKILKYRRDIHKKLKEKPNKH